MRTVATEMLGIEHPIVCGGMTATGSAELCIGVANAGGLGMLTCLHCRTPERLDLEIAKAAPPPPPFRARSPPYTCGCIALLRQSHG